MYEYFYKVQWELCSTPRHRMVEACAVLQVSGERVLQHQKPLIAHFLQRQQRREPAIQTACRKVRVTYS